MYALVAGKVYSTQALDTAADLNTLQREAAVHGAAGLVHHHVERRRAQRRSGH